MEYNLKNSKVNFILKLILALNVLVLVIKLVIGMRAGSLSIVGDAVHSGVDSLNNVIALWMVKIAAEPPDAKHPYGHSKFEALGALAVVAFLAVASFELIEKSIIRFFHPAELPHIEPLTIYLLAATLVINIFVWAYEKSAGKKYSSQILLADAEHTFSDILITASILASTYFILQGHYVLDPILGVVVALVIVRSGIEILKQSVPVLVDEAWLDPTEVQEIIASIPKAISFADLKSRTAHDQKFVEMRVQFDTDSLAEAHDLSHQIEHELIKKFGELDITIHVEPPLDHVCHLN